MRTFAPEGFAKRDPGNKQIKQVPLCTVGPNEEWSVDGHDKLMQAGFRCYGIRDKWSGKYLQYHIVPSNRHAAVIGVLYLQCVRQYGGKFFSHYFMQSFNAVVFRNTCASVK